MALVEFREATTNEDSHLGNGGGNKSGKLRNRKSSGKDEVTGKMIKDGGNRVVDWIWRLCNMAYENGAMPEDWRSALIVRLYKGKGKRKECSN